MLVNIDKHQRLRAVIDRAVRISWTVAKVAAHLCNLNKWPNFLFIQARIFMSFSLKLLRTNFWSCSPVYAKNERDGDTQITAVVIKTYSFDESIYWKFFSLSNCIFHFKTTFLCLNRSQLHFKYLGILFCSLLFALRARKIFWVSLEFSPIMSTFSE